MTSWLLLALAGCGRFGFGDLVAGDGSGGSNTDAGPSTRLKQTYNVFEDGTRQPTQPLYDSVLQQQCYLEDTAGGTICLPNDASVTYYVDAACTQAIMLQTGATAASYSFDNYSYPKHAYKAAAAINTPTVTYGVLYDGSCAANVAPAGTWFAADEITFDAFAHVTALRGTEGRLVSQRLAASDGFTMHGPLHDTLVDGDCVGGTYDDGDACFVIPTAVALYYTDNACSHVVLQTPAQVKFAMEILTGGAQCSQADFKMHAATTELPRTTPVWLDIPGSGQCVVTGTGPGYRMFDLGAAFQLAPLTRQPRTSTARMRVIEDIANGAVGDETPVWDSQLAVECASMRAADGMIRCLPQGLAYAQSMGYFTDAGCTQPVTGASFATPDCTSHPVKLLADSTGTPMGPRIFHAVKYTGPVWGGTPTNCRMYTNVNFFTEGAEVPLAMFSLVTQETDP